MHRGDICAYKNPKKKGYAVVCLRVFVKHFDGLHFNSNTRLWNTVTHKIEDFLVAESAPDQLMEYFPEQVPRGGEVPVPPPIRRFGGVRARPEVVFEEGPIADHQEEGVDDDDQAEGAADELFALDPRP